LHLQRFQLQKENNELREKLDLQRDELTKQFRIRLEKYEKIETTLAEVREENRRLKIENQTLRDQYDQLQKDHNLLQKDHNLLQKDHNLLKSSHDQLSRDVGSLLRDQQKRRNVLLLGSIGYNYKVCALLFVFGRKQLEEKSNSLHTMKDIRNAPKTPEEQHRFEEFTNKYWKDGYDAVLKKFTGRERIQEAHPTTMKEDDNRIPDPSDLQDMIKTIFKKDTIHESALDLVDSLDHLSRAVQRPILC